MNFCIAVIAFSLAVFIEAKKRDCMSKNECSLIAAFIHYFILAIYNIYLEHNRAISFWTWTSFVKSEISLKSEISNFLTNLLIFGWGKCRYTTIWVCFLWLLYYFFTFIPAHFVCLLWIEVPQR